MSQINIHKTVFDVCVVGSGAAGGVLSSRLAARGLNVIVVEGGPKVDTRAAFPTHSMPFDFKNRKMPVMMPGVAGFEDERTRGVGGKTLLWNAVSWRLSHRDFKGYTLEDAGEDWPLDYSDLAPPIRRLKLIRDPSYRTRAAQAEVATLAAVPQFNSYGREPLSRTTR